MYSNRYFDYFENFKLYRLSFLSKMQYLLKLTRIWADDWSGGLPRSSARTTNSITPAEVGGFFWMEILPVLLCMEKKLDDL